jgi:probable rRNA maturation factor
MINLRMTPRSISFDIKTFEHDAQTLVNALDYSDYDLGIWLTTNATIKRYNRMYRSQDKATDILSFAYHPELKAGERIIPQLSEDKNLGDLLISLEYVQKDAPRWEQLFEQRMRVLLVHGICHLLGYDHIEDSDYQIMKRKETALLKKLQI